MTQSVPFPFDMLMRPIKYVEKSGAFFAAVNGIGQFDEEDKSYCSIYHDDGENGWRKVTELKDDFPVTTIYSGAYGLAGGDPAHEIPPKPTFVLCGEAVDRLGTAGTEIGPEQLQQLIVTSHDGSTWKQSRRGPPGTVYLMSWDENAKTFYAEAFNNVDDNYLILKSTDGSSWSDAGTLEPSDKVSPLMEGTGTKYIKDENDFVVPYGGIFGWNGGYTWITPQRIKDAYVSSRVRECDPSVVEVILKQVDPESGVVTILKTTSAVPLKNVVTVAHNDDVWQVGGWDDAPEDAPSAAHTISVIARSDDAGVTWKKVYHDEIQWIGCILAGSTT